ncbi:hypothetical protein CLM85_07195 [Streptomyces albidoflavus]|nr:hypothetical protein CLM81_06625 [Streptomyces albidoflavus]PAX91023.1 hypothetical protein CLM82_11800 [Streptomyces albidoflavus]PBO16029.1 hypothetical protein CLM83_26360 [Streptomyces albidoflavus]PBO24961.1 hypothetical protein CLM85_07195 [Streptomyces albidoflavus]PBO30648.1 hypothetical protein CLM84_07310 [Streptomyces albidoflavus]
MAGESVGIPSRVYDEEPGECPEPGLTGTQRLILHCLYGASPGGVLMAEFRTAATECAGTAWPRHTPRPVAAALTPPAAAAARPPSPGSRP